MKDTRLHAIRRDTALLVIDLQVGFDDPTWGERSNPALESNVAALINAWRVARAPVFHIHHASAHCSGLLRLGTAGHAAKPEGEPLTGEPVYRKTVNSAFIGTPLECDLRRSSIGSVVIAGLTTNHCVSTTARMAANLGFETSVVADATAAFAGAHIDGRHRSANEVHDGALSDLCGEFAEIVDTKAVVALVARASAEDVPTKKCLRWVGWLNERKS